MKIPTSNVVQGPQGAPSEAEMLMALAEMHRQGRIPQEQDQQVAMADPPSPLQIRLNQMLYDRNLARKRGDDVYGDDWASHNAQIRLMREKIKQGGTKEDE